MKFSFVNAGPNLDIDQREAKKSIGAWPPLGILYLAAVLEKEGTAVSVLDQAADGLTIKQTLSWIKSQNPDILGFSTFATSGRTAALISQEAKKENPNIKVVFGNYYATFNPERVLMKYPSVDVIVRGEAEGTIVQLVARLSKNAPLKDVPGISFRTESTVASTPDAPLIKDLDALPFPDRSLLGDNYHSVMAGANVAPKKFTSVVSSRGCVYRCRFCSCTQFAHNRWRPRSVKNTMDELCFLSSKGYRQFIFVDDSFTANPKNVIKLCKEMRKEKLDMEWICEGRVDNGSYEMFWETAKAGCRILYFGMESANQRILNYYNKRITPDQSRTAARTARKAGHDVIVGSFIVGAPDETRAEIQNTIDFPNTMPIDIPQFNILGIFPGTDIWDEFESKGMLKDGEYWETGIAVSEIYPTSVPTEQMKRMIHEGFYHFAHRPNFLLREGARMAKSPYRLRTMLENLPQLGTIAGNIRMVT